MFKAIKDEKVIAVNDSGDFPCLVYDSIEEDAEHEAADYQNVGPEFVLKNLEDNTYIDYLKETVRMKRNSYLKETDLYMLEDFPLTEEEKNKYLAYREYLRHYTESEKWYEAEPLPFNEWAKI